MKVVSYTALSDNGNKKVDYCFFPEQELLIFETYQIIESKDNLFPDIDYKVHK